MVFFFTRAHTKLIEYSLPQLKFNRRCPSPSRVDQPVSLWPSKNSMVPDISRVGMETRLLMLNDAEPVHPTSITPYIFRFISYYIQKQNLKLVTEMYISNMWKSLTDSIIKLI